MIYCKFVILGREATVAYEKGIPLLRKFFFRRQNIFLGRNLMLNLISSDAGAIYCELVNLEREVTVTFEI